MKTTGIFRGLFAATLIALTFTACNLEGKFDGDTESASDNAQAQMVYDDIYKMLDEESAEAEALRCATLTINPIDTGVFPKTVTLDFGNGCLGTDGRYRSGQIVAIYTGRWRKPGTSITVTTTNYTVDGYQVVGTKTIVNNGENANGQLSYTSSVSNASITDPQGATFTWSCNRTLTWVEGQATTFQNSPQIGVLDDVYEITGTSSGINRNGIPFTTEITTPLRREISCKWLVSGVYEVTPDNRATRVLDFGNGACDNIAFFSVGNYSTNITLR